MRAGNSAAGATISAQPAAMALTGIASNCADSGCCAKVSPPKALIACKPWVPSDPMPDSTTAIARSRWARAREENRTLIGSRRPRGSAGSAIFSAPPATPSSVLGAITYTQSGSTAIPSTAWRTGMGVTRCSNSANIAFFVGSRCCTTT